MYIIRLDWVRIMCYDWVPSCLPVLHVHLQYHLHITGQVIDRQNKSLSRFNVWTVICIQ